MAKGKKVEDVLTKTVADMTKDVSDAVKTAVTIAAAGGDENTILLRQLQQQYSKATLKIYRKEANRGEALFVVLEGQDLKEIEAGGGLDTLCLAEGGGGQYMITIVPPGANGESKRIGPLNITGAPPRLVPKSKELHDAAQFGNALGGIPGFGMPITGANPGGLAGFGGPVNPLAGSTNQVSKGNSENTFKINDIAAYMSKQSEEALKAQEQSSDRMMMMQNQNQQQQQQQQMLMQQQQRESSQQMMAMMMGMFQNQKPDVAAATAADTEVQLLKKELEQMKQERLQDERFRAQERQMEELKRTLELQRVENTQPKGNPMLELLVPLMTSQQSQSQAQQSQLLEVMKMANERPGEDEKMSNIFSTLTMSNQATMNMVMEIAKSGLMGGGDDHPVRDAVLQGLDTLRDLGVAALSRGGEEEEEVQEVVIQQPMPEPVPQIEASEALGALPPAEEKANIQDQDALLDEEIDRFMRDAAFQRIIASLMNSDHVSEAVARLYAHAASGNKIANHWLSAPETVTAQIFDAYEMSHLVVMGPTGTDIPTSEALIENMYDFAEFVQNGGDVNKWAKTGYKPNKGKKKDEEVEVIETTETVTEPTEEEPTTIEEQPITEDEEIVEPVSEEANGS